MLSHIVALFADNFPFSFEVVVLVLLSMDDEGSAPVGKAKASQSSSPRSSSETTLPDDVPARSKPHISLHGDAGTQSRLQKVLQLKHIAMCDVYTGMGISTPWGRLFGGEILAQAVIAACATVPDTHHVHSLHGYFILAGQNGIPVMFSVDRTRTGRSFMTRTVNAKQENRTIFTLMISFHRREPGMEYEVRCARAKFFFC